MGKKTLIWVVVVVVLVIAVAVAVNNSSGSGQVTYPVPGCEDSDVSNRNAETRLGIDYYRTGTARAGTDSKTDTCNKGQLIEYVCSDGKIDSTRYDCPNGCSEAEGRCRK